MCGKFHSFGGPHDPDDPRRIANHENTDLSGSSLRSLRLARCETADEALDFLLDTPEGGESQCEAISGRSVGI